MMRFFSVLWCIVRRHVFVEFVEVDDRDGVSKSTICLTCVARRLPR